MRVSGSQLGLALFVGLLQSFTGVLGYTGDHEISSAGLDGASLTLDPLIRDWVLLPMVFIIVLCLIIRTDLITVMGSDTKTDATEAQQKNLARRGTLLRQNGGYISRRGYQIRKEYFTADKKGVLQQDVKAPATSNPMMKMMQGGQMKNQLIFQITNAGMGSWTNNFFSGFILGKIPFGLTNRFKMVTQRGIDIATLDPSYLSSLSWYLIVLFGSKSFISVLTGGQGGDMMDETQLMQRQMGMAGGQAGQWDPKKAYQQVLQDLKLAQHKPRLAESEVQLASTIAKQTQ